MTIGERERRIVRLSSAIVLGRWDEVRSTRAQADDDEPDRRWREAVLQTHLFAGFPRLVEAYEVLDTCGGLGAPAPDELEPALELDMQRARGRALFERIYAEQSARVRTRLATLRPDFADWIETHAYGRVLSRPGLDASLRELCAVAALASLGQDRQLASHARGALRCGAECADLELALEELRELVDPAVLERARRVVARLAD